MSPDASRTPESPGTPTDLGNLRVLVADDIDERGLEMLRATFKVDKQIGLTEEALCEIIEEYEALMVRSATKVTPKILRRGKRLQVVGRAGVGVDNIDVATATELGIYVVNSPLGNIVAAAEHSLALMLSLARCIPAADQSIRRGEWERSKFVGVQLHGKVMGIVGLGQVGSHVAKVAREMGMTLLAYDPYVNEMKAKQLKCQVVSLEMLLRESDFITLHVPKLPETNHLLNAKNLALLKPSCRIVNASRGGIIDEEALAAALSAGRIGGAALDVFEDEKAFPLDHPLLKAPNLVLTPHLGASTVEAQVNVAVDVSHQIRDTLSGHLPQSAVNLPGIKPSDVKDIRYLLKCASSLGRVAAQLLCEPIEDIHIVTEGQYVDANTDAILLAVANGAIGVHMASNVNFVNVVQVADNHKIGLRGSKGERTTNPSPITWRRSNEDKGGNNG
eukprot:GHVN01008203.1.p1 GENE.GHVN01008203.1~~GHVN01008203.1.p1  ORF type:complete len:447 (+),score=48.09 GHVN01008203.1:56-1396(+)